MEKPSTSSHSIEMAISAAHSYLDQTIESVVRSIRFSANASAFDISHSLLIALKDRTPLDYRHQQLLHALSIALGRIPNATGDNYNDNVQNNDLPSTNIIRKAEMFWKLREILTLSGESSPVMTQQLKTFSGDVEKLDRLFDLFMMKYDENVNDASSLHDLFRQHNRWIQLLAIN
jgi:hypothetical protein